MLKRWPGRRRPVKDVDEGSALLVPLGRAADDPQQLHELLGHPDCPWSKVLRTYGESVILIRLFRRFAELRGYDADAAEATMADFVFGRGGRQLTIVGPRLVAATRRRGIIARHPTEPEHARIVPEGGADRVALTPSEPPANMRS